MEIKSLKIGELEAKIPIVQGGMGIGVSMEKLSSAVARCGGIGTISAAQPGFKEEDFETNTREANKRGLEKAIKKAKMDSNGGIIAVNIMVAGKNYEDMVKVAIESGADIIVSGAGLPITLPELVGESNIKIVPIISSVKAIDTLIKMWRKRYNRLPDAIVVEGPLAGGHLGFKLEEIDDKNVEDILKEVKEYLNSGNLLIPVIAGGGVYTGKDAAKLLKLGADGVQMGTRFITTTECDADIKYKERYIDINEGDITIMKSPVGMPGRAIKNKFLERAENNREEVKKCYACIHKCDPRETPFCITRALINAVTGNIDEGLLFIGSSRGTSRSMQSVSDIFNEISEEIKCYE